MVRRRRAVFVEDALTVLIETFGYIVDNIGANGVVLVKESDGGAHQFPIQLPYGSDTIPDEVLEHVFSRAGFSMDDFRRALNQYLRA